VKWIADASVDR